jgi:hypothetical protein
LGYLPAKGFMKKKHAGMVGASKNSMNRTFKRTMGKGIMRLRRLSVRV